MESTSLTVKAKAELAKPAETSMLLQQIRPAWRAKRLIERVRTLLDIDPSSACQRLFNAAVHDLREKVLVAGLDIAKEAARRHKLPPIEKAEDVEDYSTARLIDLSYRMGLLNRPEWRKLHRVYEIRRDLEHEDDQYEAATQDIVYVFLTCIETVLSRDPVELLKVHDVKEIVERPVHFTATDQFLEEYERTPEPRQEEIGLFLIGAALNSTQPDLVRQNAFEMLRVLEPSTKAEVKIALAANIQQRIGRGQLDVLHAKVAYACGATPYLKGRVVADFFKTHLGVLQGIGTSWTEWRQHAAPLEDLEDVGGFRFCPPSLRKELLKWMVLTYLGESGGYGTWGRNRKVFYSNTAAPIIARIVKSAGPEVSGELRDLGKDKDVKKKGDNDKDVARRFDDLLDFVEQ